MSEGNERKIAAPCTGSAAPGISATVEVHFFRGPGPIAAPLWAPQWYGSDPLHCTLRGGTQVEVHTNIPENTNTSGNKIPTIAEGSNGVQKKDNKKKIPNQAQ